MLAITGCSPFQNEPVSRVFVLRPVEKENASNVMPSATKQALVVALPQAAPGLDTDHIILFTSEHALDYYANARWASRLPEMVRASLVGSFENSGQYASVVTDAAGLSANWLLITEIQQFEARYDGTNVPNAHVKLVTKMISLPSREVVATVEAKTHAPAAEDKIADVVNAFDAAFTQAQKQLIVEIAERMAMPKPVKSKAKK